MTKVYTVSQHYHLKGSLKYPCLSIKPTTNLTPRITIFHHHQIYQIASNLVTNSPASTNSVDLT